MVEAMLFGGLRRCEVLGLRLKVLHPSERRAFIADGKGGHQRVTWQAFRRENDNHLYVSFRIYLGPPTLLLQAYPRRRLGRLLRRERSWHVQVHRRSVEVTGDW
jgi:hypothetical protein